MTSLVIASFILILGCTIPIESTKYAGRGLHDDKSGVIELNNVHMLHPWLATIFDGNLRVCSGSIISNDVVVTSARCTMRPRPQFTVWVGSSVAGEGGTRHGVTGVHYHEHYNDTRGDIVNDIALMQVSTPFQFNNFVNKILLPKRNAHAIAPGSVANVAGWLTLEKNGSKDHHIDKMNVSNLYIVNNYLCLPHRPKEHDTICAVLYHSDRDACQEIPGSPLVMNNILVGLVPWTLNCNEPHHPKLYVAVAHYRDWIEGSLREMNSTFIEDVVFPIFWPIWS